MATFNGERYLTEQLISLEKQHYKDWYLFVSDDGSSDSTIEILKQFQARMPAGRVLISTRIEALGYARNFITSLLNCPFSTDYYAFCDQDDIWLPSKLSIAVETLSQLECSSLVLYCGRTSLIDSSGKLLGYSENRSNNVSFENALVESLAGGNTMVFGKSLVNYMRRFNFEADLISHDWLIYLIVTATSDGIVLYDERPLVLYRQHDGNVIGDKGSFSAIRERIKKVLSGRYRYWNNENERFVNNNRHFFDSRALRAFLYWTEARNRRSPITKSYFFIKSRVRRGGGYLNQIILLLLVLLFRA